jgi:hypothetical protein
MVEPSGCPYSIAMQNFGSLLCCQMYGVPHFIGCQVLLPRLKRLPNIFQIGQTISPPHPCCWSGRILATIEAPVQVEQGLWVRCRANHQ